MYRRKNMRKMKVMLIRFLNIMWLLISGLPAMTIRWDMKCYGRKEPESGRLSKKEILALKDIISRKFLFGDMSWTMILR